MKNSKKKRVIALLVLFSCASAAGIAISTNPKTGFKAAATECDHDGNWYQKVNATSDEFGHIDFCVCCKCHEIFEGTALDNESIGSFVLRESIQYGSIDESVLTYHITLNNDGGTGGLSSTEARYDKPLPTLTSLPTREGYVFKGYFSESDGEGTKYFNEDGTSAQNWDNKEYDVTLYAFFDEPQKLEIEVGYLSVVKLAAGDAQNFFALSNCYDDVELLETDKVSVSNLWDELNCSVSSLGNKFCMSSDVQFTYDGEIWQNLSENGSDFVQGNIKFSIGKYRAIGVAGNNNCNLNGGLSNYFLDNERFVINAPDSTRRWGAFAGDITTGATFTSREFNYVEDIEITRGGATGNTQWAVQIYNPIAGQRVTYSWDGTVDGDGKAKVYYKLNVSGSFVPSGTDSYFMIQTSNDGKTIKMRVAIYSNQMGTEPYITNKTGKITFDAYPFGGEMTDGNKLHNTVTKNLSGFGSAPAYVNCCPEVTNAEMIVKVVTLESLL